MATKLGLLCKLFNRKHSQQCHQFFVRGEHIRPGEAMCWLANMYQTDCSSESHCSACLCLARCISLICALCSEQLMISVEDEKDIVAHVKRTSVDLQSMSLANNSLTGTLPAAISNMTLLKTLSLAFNTLE